jgi:glycosyltransferase involved in cell wall biosynthesis
VLVGWTDDYTALRRLQGPDRRRAVGTHTRADAVDLDGSEPGEVVVVPWRGSHQTLELATEPPRTERMLALARHSTNRTGIIGFDCVPLTTAETTADGMGGAFAATLAAVRHMGRVAAISEAAAVEYLGWKDMLAGTGLPGPAVGAVQLPVAAETPSDAALASARSRFTVGTLPMVLVVGSHEPRKNHLAVLHAAESLWREGLAFSLLFVGGNSWGSRRFTEAMTSLRDRGRPVESVSALGDDLLWAAYRLAHVVLFPSLNEGFGLPVAEALACGTPVVTSRFGSMAEIARHGGALLVDPRDDGDLTAALRRVLADPATHAELARQAAGVPRRSWDDYAAELWTSLVGAGARR